jgi:hypothetical protein
MTERRYGDDEIAAIFSKASMEDQQLPAVRASREDGLTLAEVQSIGREAGISAEAVARAAQSLDTHSAAPVRRFLGLPVGVERTVSLGRWLTDAEWERLVVRLREVFDARGTMSAQGNFRQWTNGNLQALLEPTDSGHRLRLRTTKASARAGTGVGFAALGFGAVLSASAAAAGHFGRALPIVLMVVLTGLGMIASSVLPLPNWARLRGRQMDEIARALANPESEPPPASER